MRLFKKYTLTAITGIALVVIIFSAAVPYGSAEVVERIVAYVDDRAILLSELDQHYREMLKLSPDIKKEEVLFTMINRILLLREAKKLRIEANTSDAVIQEYIELRLKTFIKISDSEIKDFYNNNRKEFNSLDLDSVRDKIENYLIEKEVNQRLKQHIEELRSKAYIKLQL